VNNLPPSAHVFATLESLRKAAGIPIDDLCKRAKVQRFRYLQLQKNTGLRRAKRDIARIVAVLQQGEG